MFVDSTQKHGHIKLAESVRLKILAMSAATSDRRLRTILEHASGGRKKKSVAQNRMKKLVPVRTFAGWGEVTPGFCETDMIVRCGERNEGSVVHSLVMIDDRGRVLAGGVRAGLYSVGLAEIGLAATKVSKAIRVSDATENDA